MLVKASEVAGVHVATVCRWQTADPKFALALRNAKREARQERIAQARAAYLARRKPGHPPWVRKPFVPVHPNCPVCGRVSETRRVVYGYPTTFWRCGLWPRCSWASWRPRYPQDCPTCNGPMFWSCSRRSFACPRCRTRHWVDWGD
jgi:hypothetical protein